MKRMKGRDFAVGIALALLGALGVACQPAPAGTPQALGWQDDLVASVAGLSAGDAAELRFGADGDHRIVRGPIVAGGRLRVVYDAARLPNCRGTSHGLPAWAIALYWQVEAREGATGELHSEGLDTSGQVREVLLEVPEEAVRIAFSFRNTDAVGCSEWDDNQGATYVFAVSQPAPSATVTFGADWSESTDRPIVRGGVMRIDYAPSRLRACRATYNGGRTWNIIASWVFEPGGQRGAAALFEGDYYSGEDGVLQPEVQVPDDARSVVLWFSNSDRAGCSAWDSDFDANYHFDVVPPDGDAAPAVGWAGDFDFVVYHRDPGAHYGDRDPVWYWDRWSGSETASWVEVQVWIPGITDQAYASDDARRAAAGELRAEAVTDAFEGDGPEGWGTVDLDFERQQGNNFVYAFRFWKLRYSMYQDPPIADGAWRWFVRFSTGFSSDEGATWYEAGRDEAQARRFVVAAEEDCALFPDNPPDTCPQAREVGWAGGWGSYRSHACDWRGELEDPVTFYKSGVGHDCMGVTAELWVPGLTDGSGDPAAIIAEVETDIGFSGGPLASPSFSRLTFDGRVGNNFRYRWDLGEHVARADRGDYRYRFRFSTDGGATWTRIGADSGTEGGEQTAWRELKVRNDSSDVDEGETCEQVLYWGGASVVSQQCLGYVVAGNYDADFCELYVNALGDGNYSHNGSWANWYEAYIRVGENDGVVQNVGLWVQTTGGEELLSIGSEIEPDYWLTGFTYAGHQAYSEADAIDLEVQALSFFIDVRRPSGEVVRLWQSDGGTNYAPRDIFSVPGYHHGIGLGDIEYADESVALFDQKRACQ